MTTTEKYLEALVAWRMAETRREVECYHEASRIVRARRGLAPEGFDPVASRQYFADTITEPINASFGTITATTEQILIPTVWTPVPALEPRAGKVYELICGGTCTTGTAGTLIINARYATTITTPILATSPTQNYVASITNAPFTLRAWLIFRSIGLGGANSTALCSGIWQSGGAVATASSETGVSFASSAAVSVDTTVASALCMTVTFSVAPSVIPFWHIWRSLN